MLKEMEQIVDNARPNAAHTGLAELEQMGLLKSVLTQNVDNLHQEAGSRDVIEYHGNSRSLTCLWCNRKYDYLPRQAKQVGATIIEINLEKTVLTDGITDIFLQGKATERVSQVVSAVKALQGA